MTSTKERIGRKIKKIRELRDFTQEYVAYEIGISQGSYSDIERGQTDVSFTALEKIAGVLGVSPTALIEFDDALIINNASNMGHQHAKNTVTYNLDEKVIQLYEDKIKLLEEKIAWLESKK